MIAYPVYFIHLVFVFSLFIYLPFSKLAHMFYRSAAMCFMKYSGREAEQATEQETASAAGTGAGREESASEQSESSKES
jgi:nitrate reductase gamma subunit